MRHLIEPKDTAGPQEQIGTWPNTLGMHRKLSTPTTRLPAEFLLHFCLLVKIVSLFFPVHMAEESYHQQLPSLHLLLSYKNLEALFQKSLGPFSCG